MKRTPLQRRTPLRAKAKRKRQRPRTSSAYLDWIRGQACALPACQTPGEAHHVRTRGAGGVDRENVVPLCHLHHMELHSKGRLTFGTLYRVDLKRLAAAYDARYRAATGADPVDS